MAQAGSTFTGGGGFGATSAAGTTSSGGGGRSNPGQATSACTSYCPGYGTQCRERLTSPDCVGTCESELNGYGAACQALGVQTLTCLTPFFTPNGSNCDDAVTRALTKCNSIVKQFEACKKAYKPAPAPSTPPSGPEQNNLMGCASLLNDVGSTSCQNVFDCKSSTYIIICNDMPGTRFSSCSCTGPNGTKDVQVPAVDNPCPLAVDSCY